jgi:hypothetical protein
LSTQDVALLSPVFINTDAAEKVFQYQNAYGDAAYVCGRFCLLAANPVV